LDAHLTLEAVRVAEEVAEDGTEIGDVERGGLQPEVVDAAPAEHRRLAVGFGVARHLEDVQFGGRADADEGELDGAV